MKCECGGTVIKLKVNDPSSFIVTPDDKLIADIFTKSEEIRFFLFCDKCGAQEIELSALPEKIQNQLPEKLKKTNKQEVDDFVDDRPHGFLSD